MDKDAGCNGECVTCVDHQQFGCNPLARSMGMVMAQFAKVIELVINTGNDLLLDEIERVTLDVLKQGRAALREGRKNVQ